MQQQVLESDFKCGSRFQSCRSITLTGTGVMGLMFPWMLLESKAVNLASDKEFLMDSTLDYVLKIVDFGCLSSFRLNYLTNEEVSAAFTPKNSPF